MEGLQELLDGLKKVQTEYERQERELRQALEQVASARLMQAGAVRGVEMAIESLTKPLPEGEGKGKGGENELSGAGG